MTQTLDNCKKDYPVFEVSCKLVIRNPAGTRILLAAYDDGLYSLPGGHLEPGETPDQAARRELVEELALQDVRDLQPATFFFHEARQKVILCFTAVVDDQVALPKMPPNDEHLLGGEWIELADFQADTAGKYCDGEYRALVTRVLACRA